MGKCTSLTVESTKPRLCHDKQILNLWIEDKPFMLDTLKEVPMLVNRGTLLSSVDDKSGYDHVRLSSGSCTFFGWIPFGFKTRKKWVM